MEFINKVFVKPKNILLFVPNKNPPEYKFKRIFNVFMIAGYFLMKEIILLAMISEMGRLSFL